MTRRALCETIYRCPAYDAGLSFWVIRWNVPASDRDKRNGKSKNQKNRSKKNSHKKGTGQKGQKTRAIQGDWREEKNSRQKGSKTNGQKAGWPGCKTNRGQASSQKVVAQKTSREKEGSGQEDGQACCKSVGQEDSQKSRGQKGGEARFQGSHEKGTGKGNCFQESGEETKTQGNQGQETEDPVAR
ncbi:MAG: hypothetical protein QGI37_04660 [Verrucomicrobiota bacterium]|nr:hypothetical protein [Verrucomicrobiota bacterium]MDP7441025.1 hypothetical protein [Verrucomicrobiota bacterium]